MLRNLGPGAHLSHPPCGTLRANKADRQIAPRLTNVTLPTLDWLIAHVGRAEDKPEPRPTSRRGQQAAYFHMRQIGYVMVARNFRSPRRRGEIDLVGWAADVLSFIEVKTRTSREVNPAQAAVDRDNQRELMAMAHEYLHHLRTRPPSRVDVISVYFEDLPVSHKWNCSKTPSRWRKM